MYKAVCYRNINSDGTTRTEERIISARTLRAAKQEASRIFPVAGRWTQLEIGEHCKHTSQMIGGDRLYLIKM